MPMICSSVNLADDLVNVKPDRAQVFDVGTASRFHLRLRIRISQPIGVETTLTA
jgi:hypothetical protein